MIGSQGYRIIEGPSGTKARKCSSSHSKSVLRYENPSINSRPHGPLINHGIMDFCFSGPGRNTGSGSNKPTIFIRTQWITN